MNRRYAIYHRRGEVPGEAFPQPIPSPRLPHLGVLVCLLAGVAFADAERDAQRRLEQLRDGREAANRVAAAELAAALDAGPTGRSPHEKYARKLAKALQAQCRRLDRLKATFVEASEFRLIRQAQQEWEEREKRKQELTGRVIRFCDELEQKLREGKPIE